MAKHTFVSPAGRGLCLPGNRRARSVCPGVSFHGVKPVRFRSGRWLGFAPAGWDPHPGLRSTPADGVRAVAGVPAHSLPGARLRAIPAEFVRSHRSCRDTPGGPQRRVD